MMTVFTGIPYWDNGVETEPQEWYAAVKGDTLQLRKRIGATLVIR